MRKSIKAACLGAVCGAFFLAAAAPGSAGPLNVAVPPENGSTSLVQEVKHYDPPPGTQCIKWVRRYSSSHGFGHRRCVHWK
jgi:hypothetical protein